MRKPATSSTTLGGPLCCPEGRLPVYCSRLSVFHRGRPSSVCHIDHALAAPKDCFRRRSTSVIQISRDAKPCQMLPQCHWPRSSATASRQQNYFCGTRTAGLTTDDHFLDAPLVSYWWLIVKSHDLSPLLKTGMALFCFHNYGHLLDFKQKFKIMVRGYDNSLVHLWRSRRLTGLLAFLASALLKSFSISSLLVVMLPGFSWQGRQSRWFYLMVWNFHFARKCLARASAISCVYHRG